MVGKVDVLLETMGNSTEVGSRGCGLYGGRGEMVVLLHAEKAGPRGT